jgi:hypothetical protein
MVADVGNVRLDDVLLLIRQRMPCEGAFQSDWQVHQCRFPILVNATCLAEQVNHHRSHRNYFRTASGYISRLSCALNGYR